MKWKVKQIGHMNLWICMRLLRQQPYAAHNKEYKDIKKDRTGQDSFYLFLTMLRHLISYMISIAKYYSDFFLSCWMGLMLGKAKPTRTYTCVLTLLLISCNQ